MLNIFEQKNNELKNLLQQKNNELLHQKNTIIDTKRLPAKTGIEKEKIIAKKILSMIQSKL